MKYWIEPLSLGVPAWVAPERIGAQFSDKSLDRVRFTPADKEWPTVTHIGLFASPDATEAAKVVELLAPVKIREGDALSFELGFISL